MPTQQDFQPILDAQRQQLDLTMSASDSLDGKALGLLAANIAFVIFALQSEITSSLWILLPLLICFAASTACNVIGFASGEYVGPGVELKEHPEYFELNHEELTLQLISDCGIAIALNSQENDRKRQWLRVAFILSGVALLLLVGCIIES